MSAIVSTSVVFADASAPSAVSGALRDAVASTGGTEVPHAGHGVLAVYPSLGGALDGAVALQQAVEHHNREAGQAVELRVGVSSGDAVEDGGTYSGDPVDEAVRLSGQAAAGQILTTEVVHLLAMRGDHRFAAVDDDVCELRWEPRRAAGGVPLPSRLAAAPTGGMVVGRELPREMMLDALKATASGGGRHVLLLSGEPGIGKTTLAGDLSQRAHAEGATVLYGRCDEDLGMPYQPFVEALGGYIANAPDATIATLDERRLSELARLLPAVRTRAPKVEAPASTDPDAERYLLFGAVTAVLAEIATDAPVVLVLDDLHWADKPTALLLRHLVTTLGPAAVLLVGTYRDSDLTVDHPLTEVLAAVGQEPGVDKIPVTGLDDVGVVALLEGMAGHELDRVGVALAHAVRRETDGNPFFTGEMLRHLADTGAIRQQDGRWIATVHLAELGLPESVREVVGQRVRRLGEAAQHVLTIASVIGRDFDLDLLARVAERDEDDTRAALEAALAAQIVTEVEGRPDRCTFTHALVQHTLYDGLSASRRARIHRRIGELLEAELGDDPGDRIGELAHHWLVATKPVEAGKAARYAQQAGARALGALAPDEAIRWFRQALELLEAEGDADATQHLDALIGLGDAQRQAGDPTYRETLLDAAAEASRLEDTGRLVAAALANNRGRASRSGAVDEERIAMLERALAAVGADDSVERALLLATLGAELTFGVDLQRGRELAAEAEELARRLGDDATLLRVLNLTFLSRWVPESLDRSVDATQEALTLAARVRDPVARFWAALNRVYAMTSAADRDEVDAALTTSTALADEIRQPFLSAWAMQVRCPFVLLDGHVDEAERMAGEALQLNLDSGQPDALAAYGANLGGVRMHQGRLDELLPLIADVGADNPGLPGFQAGYPMMLCECGRLDEARPLFDAARAADFHHASYDYLWLPMTVLWADTAASLRDEPAAQVLHDRLAPYEAQGVTTSATFLGTVGMYVARLAGVLGDHDEALGLFQRADAILRAFGAPFWHARNQVDWARELLTTGTERDRADARALASEAAATAAARGCAAIERRAREVLEAAG